MNREKRLNPEKREILKPIEAIGFDLGGVLFPDFYIPVEGKIAERLEIPSRVAGEIFDEVYLRMAVGEKGASEDDLWRKLQQATQKKVSVEELRNLHRSFLIPNRKILGLIKQLARNYPLFAFSNTIQPVLDYELDHYNLRGLFITVVTSFQARARKPKPKFFRFLIKELKEFGYSPEASLLIDDREKNTQAAAEFSFQTIVFSNCHQLKTEFESRGIVLKPKR